MAQSTVSSAEPRTAQFVFVVDDSGSMSGGGSQEAADPDRLAVFAIRSLVNMLDDADEVSLVRLNGVPEGEAAPSIEPLGSVKRQILALLAPEARLAQYAGRNTPCGSALSEVVRLLNEAWRPGVAQVVMFLTDGQCTDTAPAAEQLLGQIRSHGEDLFHFYLLRFAGRKFTPELARLATASGGQALEVASDDPTTLLKPFADALTHSQGYEAELLAPGRSTIAAHLGARRVRLLAVARGSESDPPLGLGLTDQRGQPVRFRGQVATGTHPGTERVYRFAAADYRPVDSPVQVQVANAGNRWKVVAVPEYRLTARMEVRRGTCAAPGEEVLGIETGATLCVIVTLVNEEGRPVSGDITGRDIEARLDFRPAGEPPHEPVVMNQTGDEARFVVERHNLESGSWTLRSRVRLPLGTGGRVLTLVTSPRSFEASSVNIELEPPSLELGDLLPGDSPPGQTLKFNGNFPTTPGRLEVMDRSLVPTCVAFSLNGEPEGKPIEVSDGQPYSLALRAAPYCGPDTFQRRIETNLRLVFDATSGGRYLPPVVIPVRFQLVHRVDFPSQIEVSVKAGDSVTLPVSLGGNQTRIPELEAILEDPGRGRWPKDDLTLGFAAPEGEGFLRTADGKVARAGPTGFGDGTLPPLTLRLASDTCCAAGTYQTKLGLRPRRTEEYAGDVPQPIVVPVLVHVEGSGLWACRGPMILGLLLLLVLFLLLLYVASMFRNSRFLGREQLAQSLTPLRWDAFGGVIRHTKSQQEVRDMVFRSLPFIARARAWLRANPLVFGLPGRSYDETIELLLQPERQADKSRLSLVGERDHLGKLQGDPSRALGRLFASAQGTRTAFYAVPRRGCHIGRLVPERLLDLTLSENETTEKARVLRLKRREKLIHPISDEEREEGRAAGWQLG